MIWWNNNNFPTFFMMSGGLNKCFRYRFSRGCYMDSDSYVTCYCPEGYQGRRCESCAPGFEGNPMIPGDYCKPGKTSHCYLGVIYLYECYTFKEKDDLHKVIFFPWVFHLQSHSCRIFKRINCLFFKQCPGFIIEQKQRNLSLVVGRIGFGVCSFSEGEGGGSCMR